MQKGSGNLTCIYYTANQISDSFARFTTKHLLKALSGTPIISVSHKPIDLGDNILVDMEVSHINIYRQALIGAKEARTQYIALAEDDILYSPEHFKYRPTQGRFLYNVANWNLYTWNPSVFSWKGRRNMYGLICERLLFIEAMEERFAKYPNGTKDLGIWAEPGKYEKQLGVTVRPTEEFFSNPGNIMFSHEKALSYGNLGRRKKLGNLRVPEVEYWGRAEELVKKAEES